MRITILLLLFFTTACSPTLRIKPGEIPPAETPPVALKTEAENYVSAYIHQSSYSEVHSGPEFHRVRGMIERLSRAAGYPPSTFPVHLVNAGEEVNAAAFNGASIVVYTELLKRMRSDDELATVLGHEIGHILAKHYKDKEEEENRAGIVSIGSSILGAAASIAASAAGYGGVSGLAGDVTEGTTGLIGYGAFVGSFNRTQEYEADHLGLLIMARAGYDPRAALGVWQRADEIFGSADSTTGAFFSTHPASSDRFQALEEAMPFALSEYEAKKGVRNSPPAKKPSKK